MKNILFFTAPYCAACKILKPKVEQIAAKNGAQIINIDTTTVAGKESAANAGITVLPVVVVIDDNNTELKRWDGGISTIEKELPTILGGSGVTNTEGGIFTPKNLLIAAAVGLAAVVIVKNRKRKKRENVEDSVLN